VIRSRCQPMQSVNLCTCFGCLLMGKTLRRPSAVRACYPSPPFRQQERKTAERHAKNPRIRSSSVLIVGISISPSGPSKQSRTTPSSLFQTIMAQGQEEKVAYATFSFFWV
jgi:hypothetical protein